MEGRGSPRWTLVVAILGSSLAFLDGSFVSVALPVMQRELGISGGASQWVVEAYMLFLASLVLVGGALGDRLGRRRVFEAGAVLFALASLGCAAAPGALVLVAARAVQGVGAAMLVPGSLALISAAYPDDAARGAAIGTWSALGGVVGAAAPVVGGWVVAHASWRWLFAVNAPIAAAIVVLTRVHVAETRDDEAAGRVDVAGALLATLGLGLVVVALVEGQGAAGMSAWVWALLALGVAVLGAFVAVEARASAPMVPLGLFRLRTFTGANVLTFLVYGALGASFFFLPFDLIQLQGYSPAAAGAALLPFIILVSAMSRWAGALAARTGERLPLIVGPAVSTVSFVLLAMPGAGGSYWTTFFPGIVAGGLGMGFTVAPVTSAAMGSVERRHAGIASGINNAVARAAGLLAIAALGVLLSARFDAVLDARLAPLHLPDTIASEVAAARTRLADAKPPEDAAPAVRAAIGAAFADAYVAGFRAMMLACAGLTALGSLSAALLIERKRRGDAADASAGAARGHGVGSGKHAT
ncbi:MAG TPA: MFS transporter [Polyangiaceae bacterium]|jgi:EmrB/QacA subfamily drug resistance transporter|nr:MFS transporter [Polyangiaceae bacterium]